MTMLYSLTDPTFASAIRYSRIDCFYLQGTSVQCWCHQSKEVSSLWMNGSLVQACGSLHRHSGLSLGPRNVPCTLLTSDDYIEIIRLSMSVSKAKPFQFNREIKLSLTRLLLGKVQCHFLLPSISRIILVITTFPMRLNSHFQKHALAFYGFRLSAQRLS